MLQFVDRMNIEQIMQFFYGVGNFVEMKASSNEGMKDIFFEDKTGKRFWFSIADDYLCAPGFRKTSEDWKFYMLSIFGKEYWEQCSEESVETIFMNELSEEDVKIFLKQGGITVKTLEEVAHFREGTRRFKVVIQQPCYDEKEIIIGPHIKYCKGIDSMPETTFMNFFAKRFGMDFINYYIEIEKRTAESLVKDFQKRCEEKVASKMNYMVKIWENN